MTDLSSWGGFAGLAIIAACWRQVVAFLQRIRSLFIVRVTVHGDVAKAVTSYCFRNFRRSPIGDRYYRSGSAFVRPLKRMQEVAWEKPPPTPLFLFDGWRPILLGGYNGGPERSPMSDDGLVTLTILRWLTDSEALIIAALNEHNKQQGESVKGLGRYCVRRIGGSGRRAGNYGRGGSQATDVASTSPGYPSPVRSDSPDRNERFLRWSQEEIGPLKPENPMSAIVLPDQVQESVKEFRRWKDSEEWFRSRQVPWRRGWLLHGKPGTGKTSIVRALAQAADMPIFSFDLSSLSNEEMSSHWRETQENAPCIALFEDVDAVFNGRENVTGDQGGGITFDCLLNCLSGVETADGVFVIVTTNCIDKLDEALKRPGRLDRIIEMPALTADCLRQIAERILEGWPDEIEKAMAGADNLTGAQMTERCVALALERYWKEPRS